MDGWMGGGWVDGGWMDGWMGGWVGGWVVGWTGGWWVDYGRVVCVCEWLCGMIVVVVE